MDRLGLFGAALAVSLDNFFPPIPSEIILPLAGFAASQGTFSLWPFDELRHRTCLPCVRGWPLRIAPPSAKSTLHNPTPMLRTTSSTIVAGRSVNGRPAAP